MIKKLNLTKTFIASLILSAVIGTTSCSHQETKDGWEGMREGAAAESGSSDMKLSDDSSTSSSSGEVAATQESAEGKKDGSAPKEDLTATIEKKDDVVPPSDTASTEAPKMDLVEAPKASEAPAPSESLAPVASPEVAATSPAPSPDAVAATESIAPTAPSMSPTPEVAMTSPSPAPETITMDNKSLEAANTEPTLSNPTSGEEESKVEAKAEVKAEAKTVASSQVPSVPSAPMQKAGMSLNRYYFIRKGDTPATVAQKVGADSKSFQVVKGWKVGHYVMYSSKQNPSDASVVAYHAEANMAATNYKVKAGDSLSSIAKEVYGDLRSWTEVAVDNHVANPDQIAVGSVVSLFPADGQAVAQTATATTEDSQDDAVTEADTQASAETWKPETKVAQVTVPTPAAQAPVAAAPAPVVAKTEPVAAPIDNAKLFPAAEKVAREPVAEMASPVGDLPTPGKTTPVVDKAKKQSSFASMEIVQFVQRNLFMVMMALGATGFLIYAALLKARRSRVDSDF